MADGTKKAVFQTYKLKSPTLAQTIDYKEGGTHTFTIAFDTLSGLDTTPKIKLGKATAEAATDISSKCKFQLTMLNALQLQQKHL